MHEWSWQRLELEYFAPREFDHPELMDADMLLVLDEWRRRCGFPFRVTDDARTIPEHRQLYRREIEAGEPWPEDSAHPRGRAVDVTPAGGYDTPMNRLRMLRVADEMYEDGTWPELGIIAETAHIHADRDPDLLRAGKRPYFGLGVSR